MAAVPADFVPAYDVPELDAIEIIPAEQIRPLIEATRRELQILERTAAEAIAAADDAEEWARAETNDGSTSTWSLIRMHREQRDDAERDAQVMIELATRHAHHVLRDARTQADELLARGTRTEVRHEPVVPIVVAPPAPVAIVPPPPVVVPQPGPVTVPEPAPAPSPPAPPAPVEVVAPPEPPTVVAPPPAPPTIVPEPAPVAPATASYAAVVSEPEPPATQLVTEFAPPEFGTPAVATAATAEGFWPAETNERRRFSLPISAVLEAAAVLMILIFILLRLS